MPDTIAGTVRVKNIAHLRCERNGCRVIHDTGKLSKSNAHVIHITLAYVNSPQGYRM